MLRFNVCSLLLMSFEVGFLFVFLLTFTPLPCSLFFSFCCYVGLLRWIPDIFAPAVRPECQCEER